jgi:hypothetical protein
MAWAATVSKTSAGAEDVQAMTDKEIHEKIAELVFKAAGPLVAGIEKIVEELEQQKQRIADLERRNVQ